MKKSIYVAIPTIGDHEIIGTIGSALMNKSKNTTVTIGVACMNFNDFVKVSSSFILDKRVKVKMFFHKTQTVGIGRRNALSMYNDQDYVLQVDSHTLFLDNWDTELIGLYNQARSEVCNTDKLILTSYLGQYIRTKNKHEQMEILKESSTSAIVSTHGMHGTSVPQWINVTIEFVRLNNLVGNMNTDSMFYPASKISAQFVFGTKEFVKYTGLPESAVFFDEEIIQTMNLLDNNFYLVHADTELPLAHRYFNDAQQKDKKIRTTSGDLHGFEFYGRVSKSYLDFKINNEELVSRYMRYVGVNEYGRLKDNFIIPDSYIMD